MITHGRVFLSYRPRIGPGLSGERHRASGAEPSPPPFRIVKAGRRRGVELAFVAPPGATRAPRGVAAFERDACQLRIERYVPSRRGLVNDTTLIGFSSVEPLCGSKGP